MITQRYFCSESDPAIQSLFLKLKELGIEYGIQDIFSEFSGFEITIRKPKGQDSQKKIEHICSLLEL